MVPLRVTFGTIELFWRLSWPTTNSWIFMWSSWLNSEVFTAVSNVCTFMGGSSIKSRSHQRFSLFSKLICHELETQSGSVKQLGLWFYYVLGYIHQEWGSRCYHFLILYKEILSQGAAHCLLQFLTVLVWYLHLTVWISVFLEVP